MLKIEQLNQYYGQSHTLWDLSLDVPEGECTVLMGRNGVGKTTLLKCIMGLLAVKSGTLEYQGSDLKRVSAERRAALGIGYVPQGRQIFPLLSVEENLLAIGDHLENDTQIMFCRRDGNAAREDMLRMLDELKRRTAGRDIRGGVYYSCLGRGRHQFGEKAERFSGITTVGHPGSP